MGAIKKWLGLGLLGILLCSCIEQEVNIKLNADGSGTVSVRRRLSDMEREISLLGKETAPEFKSLTVLQHSIEKNDGEPNEKFEISEYAFTNLAVALPELESIENVILPRFTNRDGQLVVFMRNEMNPYRGSSSNNQTNLFYHLTIDFPVAPQSESGTVEGNRFIWKANHNEITTFRKSDIGTLAFECSIPADAIEMDLQPRLVARKPESTLQEKKRKLITALDVRIPIIATDTRWSEEDSNAKMTVALPVDPALFPLCYQELKLENLVIDGQKVEPTLSSETSGVFSGKNQYGQDVPGLPVQFQFAWNTPLLKQIDRIQVSVQAAKPARTSEHTLDVETETVTNAVLAIPPGKQPDIAVLEVKHAHWQAAVLKLATTLNPMDLSQIYLDTAYGLRYPAQGLNWIPSKKADSTSRKAGEAQFGPSTPFWVVDVYYPHIPTTSFALTFVKTEELLMSETVLTEVKIDVQ